MNLNLNREESLEFLEICRTSSRWAEAFLRDPNNPNDPLKLRLYQKEFLDASMTKEQIALRWGRRCVVGETPIQMVDGSIKYIKDIKIGDIVVSQDKDGLVKSGKVIDSFSNGMIDVYEVRLNDGRVIKCTKDHELLAHSINGKKKSKKQYLSINSGLKKGDEVVVLKEYETYGNYHNLNEAKLLGYLLTDGHIVETQTPKFTGNNYLYIDEVKDICKELFDYECVITERKESKAYDIHLTDSNKGTTNKVKNWLRSINLLGKKEKFKNVFDLLIKFDKESLGCFLNRLWSGDGCISLWYSKDRPNGMRLESSLSSGNLTFITQLQTFLYKFGISAKIKKDERICKFTGKMTLNYKLYFSDRETVENFFNLTGPIYGKEINSLKALEELKKREFKRIVTGEKDFRGVKVNSIKYIGKEEVFDISVLDHNNYTTNGIVSHNCGKSAAFCVDALWNCLGRPFVQMMDNDWPAEKPYKVLIVTPMDTQIKLLFDMLISLANGSPLVQQEVKKIVRSDCSEIHFKNGSVIKGLTIGISTGNKGTSIRGQDCDYLLVDEGDYIPEKILYESIIPITTSKVGVITRFSSTPSGKREYFYKICTDPELGWWHSHVPSWHPDNPGFMSIEKALKNGVPITDSHEYKFKRSMPISSYEREYGAEFGEELAGVYKHSHIKQCLVNYNSTPSYHSVELFDPGFKQNPANLYIIGVDWNSYLNGGQVVMVEYCNDYTINEIEVNGERKVIDFTGKFRLFWRKSVQSKDSTQRDTRNEIIRLLRDYKIDFLYVDYGHGDTNIEELTLVGNQHPELRLDQKLRAIDSGSSVDHYDPVMKETISKRVKSLMVNFAVISVEEGRVLLPSEEDASHKLVNQMRNYKIKNITNRGDYTYEGEDHILDAFHLAIYGFYREYGDLLTPRILNRPIFVAGNMHMNMSNSPIRKSTVELPILNNDPEERNNIIRPVFLKPKRFSRSSNFLSNNQRRGSF